MKITEKVNTEAKINNQTIKQIESTLSILNSKKVNYDEFKKRIRLIRYFMNIIKKNSLEC
jgi:hypothetical protein